MIKGLLEQAGAHALDVTDFMKGAVLLDKLFLEQKFVLTAWSKRQKREQIARNAKAGSPLKVKQRKSATAASSPDKSAQPKFRLSQSSWKK